MQLTSKQKKHLRGLAHSLNPVVMIGNDGLTENVLNEIRTTIAHHELIKVKINGADKVELPLITDEIVKQVECIDVQRIGKVVVFYRQAKKPVIVLPKGR
jgi:RNA-binding protein